MAGDAEWNEGWPDWQDEGRTVVLLMGDGAVVSGELVIYDQTAGPDEAPIWVVRSNEEAAKRYKRTPWPEGYEPLGNLPDDTETDISFVDAEKWRFDPGV